MSILVKHGISLLSHISAAAMAVVLLTACGPDKESVRIEGKFRHLDKAEFYVYNSEGSFEGLDTIRIDGGKFSFDRKISEPEVLTLLYPNFSRTYIIVEPGKTIRIEADAERLEEADVSGTDENKRLTEFRQKNVRLPDGDALLAAQQYIRDNASSMDAVAVYMQYFAYAKSPSANDALQLLGLLRQKQPKSRFLEALDSRLRPVLQMSAGMSLPDFTAETTDGRTLTKAELTGQKPLLITFLASWSSESREALHETNRLMRAHGESLGQLVISLDMNKKLFSDFAKSDSLRVAAVCDGEGLASPLASSLGVHYVPGNILVDKGGRIVARDLKKEDLENTIARLLK